MKRPILIFACVMGASAFALGCDIFDDLKIAVQLKEERQLDFKPRDSLLIQAQKAGFKPDDEGLQQFLTKTGAGNRVFEVEVPVDIDLASNEALAAFNPEEFAQIKLEGALCEVGASAPGMELLAVEVGLAEPGAQSFIDTPTAKTIVTIVPSGEQGRCEAEVVHGEQFAVQDYSKDYDFHFTLLGRARIRMNTATPPDAGDAVSVKVTLGVLFVSKPFNPFDKIEDLTNPKKDTGAEDADGGVPTPAGETVQP